MATETYEDPRIIEFDVRTDEMLVNMGPQHPSTHGVLRLVLRTDGEVVHEVTPHIGYASRESYALYYAQMLEDIEAWLGGAPIRQLLSAVVPDKLAHVPQR